MKFCQFCGNELHEGDTECPACHSKVEAPVPTETHHYRKYINPGSYGGGWALGFFLGLAGLIIALCLDQSETKRGAISGFVISLIIAVVIIIIVGCVELSLIGAYN